MAKLSDDMLFDLLPSRVPFCARRTAAGLELRELSLEEMCRFFACALRAAGMLELVALRIGPALLLLLLLLLVLTARCFFGSR